MFTKKDDILLKKDDILLKKDDILLKKDDILLKKDDILLKKRLHKDNETYFQKKIPPPRNYYKNSIFKKPCLLVVLRIFKSIKYVKCMYLY
jgi:hypothetical protein